MKLISERGNIVSAFADTQSIIVYRNPAEAALWEAGMANGFALVVGMVVGLLVATTVATVWQKVFPRSKNVDKIAFLAAVIGVVGSMFLVV